MPRAIPWLFLAGTWLLISLAASGQTQQLPTAATTASVVAETLTVFAGMDGSSEVVRSLNKGDGVYVDLRIDQGTMKWCGIRLTAQTNRLGFADCRGLVRTSAPMVTGSGGATGSVLSSGSRGAPSEIPFARPAAPTQRGYAAVQAEVVKEGVVDSGYIATAEAEARSGGPAGVTRAALAHYAAA